MKRFEFIVSSIIIISFCISLYFYNQVPDMMASHWNIKGEVDGYSPKMQGLFLVPATLTLCVFLFTALPKIDPMKKNIKRFKKYYEGFIIIFCLFMFFVHLKIILWNIGIRIQTNIISSVLFSMLFFYIGILLEKSKRNWFIGIRTPWTLSRDDIWDKTNKICGKLFKISALITFLGFFYSIYSFYFVVLPPMMILVFANIYSYFQYEKLRDKK